MKIFRSFFLGGYECADHINRRGDRVDLLRETAHDTRIEEDYEAIRGQNIATVREGICWSRCEPQPFSYDFSEVARRLRCGEEHGVQQIWDICHFGFPIDLSPTHPAFCRRFTSLCQAFVKSFRATTSATLFVTPINEISFLSWYGGNVRGTVPFMTEAGWDVKYHLCQAAISGIRAILAEDPSARIVTVEPLIHIHPPAGQEETEEIRQHNSFQYQAMDMIGGSLCPELGGRPEYLDILGFNYYHNCQWEFGGPALDWTGIDERRIPLSQLLQRVYTRYGRPMLLSETGHYGVGRVDWLNETARECRTALKNGVPLLGVCLYPIVDRPDWDDLHIYVQSGLFDMDASTKERKLDGEYARALQDAITGVEDQQRGLPRPR